MTDEERAVAKKREIISKYLSEQQEHIVDGYDTDTTIIVDEQAYKTIDSILTHKTNVSKRLNFLSRELDKRAERHDDSKLHYPELGWLINMDKEGRAEYGSEEYFEKQKKWKKFFDHHYRNENNRHHPDHFAEACGTLSMDIVDLAEMVCDVISYYDKLPTKKSYELIEEQQKRFGMSEEVAHIITNTITNYFSWFGDYAPAADAGAGI